MIYTASFNTPRVVDDKLIVDERLKKLYQAINISTTPEEIIKIKQEYHSL